MKSLLRTLLKILLKKFNFYLTRTDPEKLNTDKRNASIIEAVKPYTMTTPANVNALIEAVRYIVDNHIDGAIVECGVWKGGSSIAAALTLQELGIDDRDIYLYDTFSGMPAPTDSDVSVSGIKAESKFLETKTSDDSSTWVLSSLNEVKENFSITNYPKEKVHFIKGKVEETIPDKIPQEIALLRLDTDWYKSTKHEMIYLFPLLKKNGILIIDDYGSWQGAKQAIDEYILENNICIFLCYVTKGARIAIKTN